MSFLIYLVDVVELELVDRVEVEGLLVDIEVLELVVCSVVVVASVVVVVVASVDVEGAVDGSVDVDVGSVVVDDSVDVDVGSVVASVVVTLLAKNKP